LESFSARRAAIIYNPVARTVARNEQSLLQLPELLAATGMEAHLVPTTGPGTAGAQAKQQIQEGCDLILVAGGDGTINEVSSGLLHSRVPLGILPGGTANVLARELRLPQQLVKAAQLIPSLKSCRIVVGSLKVHDAPARPFLCMAGIGLDAEIVYRLNLDLKAVAGKFAYYLGGFSQVLRPISEFHVVVDDREFSASFVLISRVRNYGGDLEIARGASLLRDDFEIVLFRGTLSVRYLTYLAGVATRQLHRMKGVTVLHGKSVSLVPHKDRVVYVQADGELAGTLPAHIHLAPAAINLLVPPQYLARERARFKVAAYA